MKSLCYDFLSSRLVSFQPSVILAVKMAAPAWHPFNVLVPKEFEALFVRSVSIYYRPSTSLSVLFPCKSPFCQVVGGINNSKPTLTKCSDKLERLFQFETIAFLGLDPLELLDQQVIGLRERSEKKQRIRRL